MYMYILTMNCANLNSSLISIIFFQFRFWILFCYQRSNPVDQSSLVLKSAFERFHWPIISNIDSPTKKKQIYYASTYGIGHFWVVADKARVALQVVTIELHEALEKTGHKKIRTCRRNIQWFWYQVWLHVQTFQFVIWMDKQWETTAIWRITFPATTMSYQPKWKIQ